MSWGLNTSIQLSLLIVYILDLSVMGRLLYVCIYINIVACLSSLETQRTQYTFESVLALAPIIQYSSTVKQH